MLISEPFLANLQNASQWSCFGQDPSQPVPVGAKIHGIEIGTVGAKPYSVLGYCSLLLVKSNAIVMHSDCISAGKWVARQFLEWRAGLWKDQFHSFSRSKSFALLMPNEIAWISLKGSGTLSPQRQQLLAERGLDVEEQDPEVERYLNRISCRCQRILPVADVRESCHVHEDSRSFAKGLAEFEQHVKDWAFPTVHRCVIFSSFKRFW